jgi:Flp pilus assembly protein TadG
MSNNLNRTYRQSERGSVAVEFALLIPVLLLVLFGIINFGVLMYNQAVITNAAREGARWAAIHTTATYGTTCSNSYSLTPVDPCQTAYSYAYNNLISFGGNYLLTATYSPSANFNSGTAQTVTIGYTYTGIGWFFGALGATQYSSTAVMLHE